MLIRLFLVAVVLLVVVFAIATLVFFRITHRVEGEYFDSNGVRLHYTVQGEGEPVVLLHGFAVNADLNWRLPGITQALAEEFRVIALDLRGHGLSDKPHDVRQYGMQMVRDVTRLLDHLQIGKAHVVGYSLGGLITIKLATTYPERLLTASPLGAGWERTDNSAFLGSLGELERALKSGRGIGPLAGRLGSEREKPGLLHTGWVRFMTRYLNDGHALSAMVRGIPDLTVEEEALRTIPVPVCGIVGSRDPLRVGVEALKGRVPDLRLVIVEGADHIRAPRSRELLEALRGFLRQQSSGKTGREIGVSVPRAMAPGMEGIW
jgi:pimeloyl-ACP methyl ester carboxylesterase